MRRLLDLDDEIAVTVRRLACAEPGRPAEETVVAVLLMDGEPSRWRLHRPVEHNAVDDLRAVLLPDRPVDRKQM